MTAQEAKGDSSQSTQWPLRFCVLGIYNRFQSMVGLKGEDNMTCIVW